jgi:hypothetical protein
MRTNCRPLLLLSAGYLASGKVAYAATWRAANPARFAAVFHCMPEGPDRDGGNEHSTGAWIKVRWRRPPARATPSRDLPLIHAPFCPEESPALLASIPFRRIRRTCRIRRIRRTEPARKGCRGWVACVQCNESDGGQLPERGSAQVRVSRMLRGLFGSPLIRSAMCPGWHMIYQRPNLMVRWLPGSVLSDYSDWLDDRGGAIPRSRGLPARTNACHPGLAASPPRSPAAFPPS